MVLFSIQTLEKYFMIVEKNCNLLDQANCGSFENFYVQ